MYLVLARLFFPNEKERAYILSAICASTCTLIGFYVCHVELEWSFFNFSWEQAKLVAESQVTRMTTRFFIISNIVDIIIGLIEYPSQLFILTTWVHHGAYVLLCCWMLKSRCSILFGICLLEEIPTAILAYGRLNKKLRSDYIFGFTYFILRVALHSFLLYGVFFQLHNDERLSVIRFNFFLTELLHVHWFISWIRQQNRLNKEASKRKQ